MPKQREVTVRPEALRYLRSVTVILHDGTRRPPMSQKELADASGISPTLVALIETGERQPSLVNALAVARALKAPLESFAEIHVDLSIPAGTAA